MAISALPSGSMTTVDNTRRFFVGGSDQHYDRSSVGNTNRFYSTASLRGRQATAPCPDTFAGLPRPATPPSCSCCSPSYSCCSEAYDLQSQK